MAFKFKLLGLVFFIETMSATIGYEAPWGKDASLFQDSPPIFEPLTRKDPLSQVLESIIVFHQNVITPIDGPRSHFRPTSSRYMLLSIRRYGPLWGYLKGCDRLLRENKDPWLYHTIVIDDKRYKWDPTLK